MQKFHHQPLKISAAPFLTSVARRTNDQNHFSSNTNKTILIENDNYASATTTMANSKSSSYREYSKRGLDANAGIAASRHLVTSSIKTTATNGFNNSIMANDLSLSNFQPIVDEHFEQKLR